MISIQSSDFFFLDNRSSDSDDIDSVWEKEITERVQAVDEETAVGINYDRAMQKLRNAYTVSTERRCIRYGIQ